MTVPVVKFNTKVESGEIKTTVENLENAISASEKSKITDNTNKVAEIVVTLTATKTKDEATDAAITDDNKNVKDVMNKAVEDQNTETQTQQLVEYIDVTLTQVEKKEDGSAIGEEKTLTTTTQLQTISFEITNDLYAALASVDGGMDNIIVYRLHNGSTQQLKKVAQENGERAAYECYWVKTVEGVSYIVVKANQFSTYAFGVQNTEVENYTAPVPTSGGGATTYTVTTADTANGKLTVDKKNASSGSTVTITATPDKGFTLETLTVLDKNGKEITVENLGNNKFSFNMPSSKVTVSVTFAKAGACPQDATCVYAKFTDADTKEWYHDGVHYCVANGMMNGVSDTQFAPSGTLTRGMVVTVLARLSGTTVNATGEEWYADGQKWAVANGISDGTDMTANITREQLATMLYRYAQFKGIDVNKVTENTNTLSHEDVFTISDWATSGMHFCIAAGVVGGDDNGMLNPLNNATRAEAATMFQRFCENVVK